MLLSEILGNWDLVGSTSKTSQIALANGEPEPNGVSDWLNGINDSMVTAANTNSGMTISFASDGTFSECVTGSPKVQWFDEEGVLQADATPFNGIIVWGPHAAFLRPVRIASWAVPVEGRYGNAALRYDDGDTKISDCVRMVAGQLVRTVNVVTDELYLDRVVMVYRRRA